MDPSGTLRGWAIFLGAAALCLVVLVVAIDDHHCDGEAHDTGPSTAAVITIGDPQVYARETLINDRRQEIDYLNKLIEESVTRDFAPQIVRDLKTLEKVRAVLSVSVGPPAADQADQTQSSPAPLPPDTEIATPPPPNNPAEIEGQQEGVAPPPPKRTLPGISPIEEFRDRQVYRAELRAALAAASLDDLHDFGGNALYRLQFNASILPGAAKSRSGVAKLVVQRPRVTKADIEGLYYAWINHVGRRLNPGYVNRGGTWSNNTVLREFYIAVGDVTQVFRPLMFCYTNCRSAKKRESILLPVPWLSTKAHDDLTTALGVDRNGELGTGNAPGVYALLDDLAGLQDLASSQKTERISILPQCDVLAPKDSFKNANAAARVLARAHAARMMATALLGLERSSLGESKDLPDKLYRLQSAGAQVRKLLLDHALDKPNCAKALERDYAPMPDAFLTAILHQQSCFGAMYGESPQPPKPHRCILTGNAFAYGTTPIELSQRVSSSVSLAHSLELALAASTTLTRQASAKQNLEWMQNAAEKIERTDRLPLTIGYSTRTAFQVTPLFEDLTPEFGWVFGPGLHADKNGSGLHLSQVPRSEALTADLSVPTWWPFLKLDVQTAWIENWNGSTKPMGNATEGHQRYIEVRFPKKSADLDLVTQRLLAGDVATSTAGRQPFIERVRPNDVSVCAGKTTFVIQGTNIWRGTNVFLGGVEAKTVSVLPDMEGITAEFEMSGAFTKASDITSLRSFDPTHAKQHGKNARALVLSVATRNGSTETEITVTAANGKQNCAAASLLNAPRRKPD